MSEQDPVIVESPLSQWVTKDGITVEVSIIRLEHEREWSLEVINAVNTSIVWDNLFPTDKAAYAEFERTVAEEGMKTFLDSAKIIPFPR
jgi:hypothetical protein